MRAPRRTAAPAARTMLPALRGTNTPRFSSECSSTKARSRVGRSPRGSWWTVTVPGVKVEVRDSVSEGKGVRLPPADEVVVADEVEEADEVVEEVDVVVDEADVVVEVEPPEGGPIAWL